jgi:uncharacterized protein YPO0396
MTTGRDFTELIKTARDHYESVRADLPNAKDRVEHIRLSSLAQEAQNLVTDLATFEIGLVYSHTNNTDAYIEERIAAANNELTVNVETGEILDGFELPEFKSPYNPRNL